MRIIVSLFNQSQLLSLRGVQAALDAIRLLQLLQGEDEQLRVMLVRKRTEKRTYQSDPITNLQTGSYGNGIGANFLLSNQWTVDV